MVENMSLLFTLSATFNIVIVIELSKEMFLAMRWLQAVQKSSGHIELEDGTTLSNIFVSQTNSVPTYAKFEWNIPGGRLIKFSWQLTHLILINNINITLKRRRSQFFSLCLFSKIPWQQ